jgi:hypothetical protein
MVIADLTIMRMVDIFAPVKTHNGVTMFVRAHVSARRYRHDRLMCPHIATTAYVVKRRRVITQEG